MCQASEAHPVLQLHCLLEIHYASFIAFYDDIDKVDITCVIMHKQLLASLTPPSLLPSLSFINYLTHLMLLRLLPHSHSLPHTSCLSYSSLPPSHSLPYSLPVSLTPPLPLIYYLSIPASLTPPSLSFIASLTSYLSYSSLPPSHLLSHSLSASLTPPSLSLSTSLFFL